MTMPLGIALLFIEQRRQAMAEEPVRLTPEPRIGQADAIVGDGRRDSFVRRGFAEALACQDMLERVPAQPSPVARLIARFVTTVRAIAGHETVRQPRAAPDPRVTL